MFKDFRKTIEQDKGLQQLIENHILIKQICDSLINPSINSGDIIFMFLQLVEKIYRDEKLIDRMSKTITNLCDRMNNKWDNYNW